jgi:DivIVA domain-containing protein
MRMSDPVRGSDAEKKERREDTPASAPLPRYSRRRGAVEKVRDVHFSLALRGYDRGAVDSHLAKVAQLVAELEATQLRETIVQRALDEVGEQTSSILQRAHETAEEISVRSRAQAEGRIQRAEREAEEIRRAVVEEKSEIEADILRLRQDRVRLIEEIRHMAEEVLGVADEALDRLPEPDEEDEPPIAVDHEELGAAQPEELGAAQPDEPAPEEPEEMPAAQPEDGGGPTVEFTAPAAEEEPSAGRGPEPAA